jgi:hypothetical protein
MRCCNNLKFQQEYLQTNPKKETDKGALVSLRKFLENAGIKPKEKKKS